MYDDQWKNVYTWRKAPIVLERFWRSLKYNEVCMNDYESPRETRHGMAWNVTSICTITIAASVAAAND